MTFAELRPTRFAFGANCTPPAGETGGFVCGSLDAARQVVQAEPLFRAYHELELPTGFDPDSEAFGTVYQYPEAEYAAHVREHGSPKGYAGPAACCRLPWDINRAGNLDAALADTRKLARFLRDRYGELAECGLSVWFSGSKGFHLSLLAVPGFDSRGSSTYSEGLSTAAFRGSAELEFGCDSGYLLHSDPASGVARLECVKQRFGRPRDIPLRFCGAFQRFEPGDDLDGFDAASGGTP